MEVVPPLQKLGATLDLGRPRPVWRRLPGGQHRSRGRHRRLRRSRLATARAALARWAAEDGPDGSQEDTQAWQGWSGWRSHGREHTTGQPGQPWHDEAWRRDRASQGSTQERGPVGETGGAHSAPTFPSQGKGTSSVHRQDRSLEKAYRKNAEARAKRDPEAKRVSRSSFLRNRQRALRAAALVKSRGKHPVLIRLTKAWSLVGRAWTRRLVGRA